MGLFKKGGEKKIKEMEVPKLPELPTLPELPDWEEKEDFDKRIPQLPSFPNGSLGDRFSQDTIKEAVAGKKVIKEVDADEFVDEDMQMMQAPLIKERLERESQRQKIRETEPIFIRLDKFEEGSKIFEEVKKQFSDIERMLRNVKEIKEKEETEVREWEEEIRQIKEKMDNIDSNIFSKV